MAEVSDEADDASPVGNGHAVAVAEKAEAKPIDWEIPRKVLHSSIGMFPLFHRSVRVHILIANGQASSRCIFMLRTDLHNTLYTPSQPLSASSYQPTFFV